MQTYRGKKERYLKTRSSSKQGCTIEFKHTKVSLDFLRKTHCYKKMVLLKNFNTLD